jgi:hypothetical protein
MLRRLRDFTTVFGVENIRHARAVRQPPTSDFFLLREIVARAR